MKIEEDCTISEDPPGFAVNLSDFVDNTDVEMVIRLPPRPSLRQLLSILFFKWAFKLQGFHLTTEFIGAQAEDTFAAVNEDGYGYVAEGVGGAPPIEDDLSNLEICCMRDPGEL